MRRASVFLASIAAYAGVAFSPLISCAIAQDKSRLSAPVQAPFETERARTSQRPPMRYFIEFRARSAATYGHMYVLYGQLNRDGEIIRSDIAGLHPAGDSNDCENCSVLPWTAG